MDIGWLFDTSGFPPRWQCGTWSRELGWTYIVSDLLIFGAYFAIPLLLLVFVLRGPRVPFTIVFWLFMAFILCCGLTHLISAIIFYEPVYRLSAVMKAITAIVSWATVLKLIRVIPRALELPGLKSEHERLLRVTEARNRLDRELAQAKLQLEERSSALTLQNRHFREAMQGAQAVARQWEIETGRIVWELGLRHWMLSAAPAVLGASENSWADLLAPDEFRRLQQAANATIDEHGAVRGMTYAELLVHRDGKDLRLRFAGTVDPRVTGSPRTITGIFRLALEVPSSAT